ncbi:histone deacetylase family protein [Roseiterribacter gracilis]|uniref:Acetylpolyamine amidohydrolase n=1 Tax=Roseiterribacter gracilis TaxID=2812848 RepID=A0A8S8XBS7_9PROT|nr:acetylpolyamine amidohydrolase [Rhodospirillales bacterium TMPK1]
MRILHAPDSVLHDPSNYVRRGETVPHPEKAARYHLLLDAARNAGHAVERAGDHGIEPIAAVHTQGHIEFFRTAWSRRDEWPTKSDEIFTGHFARPQMHRRPEGFLGLVGYHTADTSTPIRAGTWAAIYGSAQAAISAADAALADGRAYALCRPPGHHAYAESAGGFCYLNNAAIAARRLQSKRGGKIAIVDIDVHHGNGTQGIFYEDPTVLTISIHADTSNYFPFYSGYADETGTGAGSGFNLNLPLQHGLGDGPFVAAIEQAMARVAAYEPNALVVALGLDASEHDPIGALRVTTQGFADAARTIARGKLPTVLVQEGGYLSDVLATNLTQFLAAFDAAA